MLRITEIFHSLQGESNTIGIPTVFIRLTGSPLRCQYCDTAYAFKGGTKKSLKQILDKTASFECQYVCVTGGEPLAQQDCLELLTALCEKNYKVSLETSGAISIANIDPRVTIVMDLKTPDSGEEAQNKWSNLDLLTSKDQLKFVICSRDDYNWACNVINKYNIAAQLIFSPSFGQLEPTNLANWILQDRLNVRFQIQLHKLLWQDQPGH